MLTLSALGATAQVIPPPQIPWHPVPWIDTVPRESKDKPCTVDALEVTAKVKGLFSRVDTVITLRNPNGRVISCPLQFPLPDNGTVCGYALEIGGQMVDGVVVPKEKARVAFETEQRKGVYPGLVEAVKGNNCGHEVVCVKYQDGIIVTSRASGSRPQREVPVAWM